MQRVDMGLSMLARCLNALQNSSISQHDVSYNKLLHQPLSARGPIAFTVLTQPPHCHPKPTALFSVHYTWLPVHCCGQAPMDPQHLI